MDLLQVVQPAGDTLVAVAVESIKVKQELRAYLKYASVYARIIKPYTEAKLLLTQAENYTHYEELEREYLSLKTQ